MNGNCCSGDAECCYPEPEHRRVEIDFLYLDLTVCTRCIGPETNLEAAIREVSNVLKMAGFDVVVNKISITSKELAVKHKFLSSPTIRVNGRDIQPNIRESACEGCADLYVRRECGLSGLDTRRNRIHSTPKGIYCQRNFAGGLFWHPGFCQGHPRIPASSQP